MQVTALTPHAIAVLALTLVALYLFSRDRIPIETSSLIILTLLTVGFTLFPFSRDGKELEPAEFFLGFGNEALIAISALMVASESLVRTGALTPVGRVISRYWASAPLLVFGCMLLVTALLSAFMNNTPQVVLMIPILVSVALRSGMPASSTLMPMTFAAQIGGMGTPIGTSLNLLVITSAAQLGVHKFGMFDFFIPAAIASCFGITYLWLLAPRMIPFREPKLQDVSPRVFTTQLSIPETSGAVGKSVSEAIAITGGKMKILRIQRQPGFFVIPLPDLVIQSGDRLFLQDTPPRLKEIEQALGGTLSNTDEEADPEELLSDKDQQLAELVITPHSDLDGRTLMESDFDERYQLVPLAHHRVNEADATTGDLHQIRLNVGDVLLVQGDKERIAELRKRSDILVLDATTDLPQTSKAPLALMIMGGIILLASFKIMPVAMAALLGVCIMILTECLDWRSALRALDSQMIFLTVGSIAISVAMVATGAAGWLAELFASVTHDLPGTWILSALMLFMAVMSNIVSNSAAAVIGTPIAVKIAQELGYSPEAFVLAVLFGVNMSYATPMADNCNLLIYSAGNYKFSDFLRIGIPLTLIMWLSYTFLLPIFFPL